MTPLTGDDVADLHLVADAHGCTWATATGLVAPFIVDLEARCVWVNGRLEITPFFQAVRSGLDEIVRDLGTTTVVPFRQRTG